LWPVDDVRAPRRLALHSAPVRAIAFSPDSARVVTAAEDRACRVFETATGRELFAYFGHQGIPKSVAFSPDGGSIVSSDDHQEIRVWRASIARSALALEGAAPFDSATLLPRSGLALVGAGAAATAVCELATGRRIATLAAPLRRELALDARGERIVQA